MTDTGKTEEWLQQTEEWLQHDDHLYEVLQAMGMELLAEVNRLRGFVVLVREYFGEETMMEFYRAYNSEGQSHFHRLFTGEEK